jgi:hypothetical protein
MRGAQKLSMIVPKITHVLMDFVGLHIVSCLSEVFRGTVVICA